MKKLITLLLAAAMLLSMTACGGAAEPVETAPATTEPIVTEAPTEAPTEEPTEAPTEPRVAPTDFEAVDPATLPDPIPVEEQLLSEDTKTVTFETLEEYEDLLWELGFKEVRLAGSHEASVPTSGNNYGLADVYCQPVGITYNDNAFRLNFTYIMRLRDGDIVEEDGWCMYGTKASAMVNVSPMDGKEYYNATSQDTKYFAWTIDNSQYASNEESIAAALEAIASGTLNGTSTKIQTANYEEYILSFGLIENDNISYSVKTVYYPQTGNLYNYMRDPNSEGEITTAIVSGELVEMTNIGMAARTMCFHYLFPAEDAAE